MKKSSNLFLDVWQALATALVPLLKPYLRHRCQKGKEIKERLSERMGYASLKRPQGSFIHFHAASVGEVISIFPIITDIHKIDPHQYFLITTGTVTSYYIVQQQFSENMALSQQVYHQFIPLDVPKWVHRFVAYWRPCLSVIVESELWPNLIDALQKNHVPLALMNARLSERSFKTWQRFGKTAYALLSKFDWIAARSVQDQQNFCRLGVKAVCWGDIKQVAPELSYNSQELQSLQERFDNKPIWLAASTHQGEEQEIIYVHHQLRQQHSDLITIIVPRHPERATQIIEQTQTMPRRSLNQFPDETGLWLCDSLGELGLFYRLCDIVFIGNSLDITRKGGGHNPFEPAKLHCAIASGQKYYNFQQAYALLKPAVQIVFDANDLALWVHDLLLHPCKKEQQANKALEIMKQQNRLAHDIAVHLYQLKA